MHEIGGEQMNDYRIEVDSLGEVRVPSSAYCGAHTQRAIENFPISGRDVRVVTHL